MCGVKISDTSQKYVYLGIRIYVAVVQISKHQAESPSGMECKQIKINNV